MGYRVDSALIARRRIAALGALGVAALLVVLLFTRSGGYEVRVQFDQVDGLVEGADVDAAGLRVGSVEEIGLGDEGLPLVTLKVDDGYRLRKGATADLRAASASGEVNRFISLTQGTGRELPDGATIDSAHSDQPVEIGRILSTLGPRGQAEARQLLASLDAATAGTGDEMAATLRNSGGALANTAEVLRQVGSDGRALQTLVQRGRQVVGALATNRDRLASTADSAAAVLAVTARRQGELARATENLPAGLAEPRRALQRLDASVGHLRGLVGAARPGIAAAVPFARDLRPTLAAARPMLAASSGLVSEAPSNLRRLRPLLTDAGPFLRILDPVLRSAAPILDEGRARTPDFFSFFSNWADFTSNYDANGHAARVGLVLPPAPNNTIGPNDAGGGSLRAPFVRTPGVLEGDPWTNYKDSNLGDGEEQK